jgi:hypothetical protein
MPVEGSVRSWITSNSNCAVCREGTFREEKYSLINCLPFPDSWEKRFEMEERQKMRSEVKVNDFIVWSFEDRYAINPESCHREA